MYRTLLVAFTLLTATVAQASEAPPYERELALGSWARSLASGGALEPALRGMRQGEELSLTLGLDASVGAVLSLALREERELTVKRTSAGFELSAVVARLGGGGVSIVEGITITGLVGARERREYHYLDAGEAARALTGLAFFVSLPDALRRASYALASQLPEPRGEDRLARAVRTLRSLRSHQRATEVAFEALGEFELGVSPMGFVVQNLGLGVAADCRSAITIRFGGASVSVTTQLSAGALGQAGMVVHAEGEATASLTHSAVYRRSGDRLALAALQVEATLERQVAGGVGLGAALLRRTHREARLTLPPLTRAQLRALTASLLSRRFTEASRTLGRALVAKRTQTRSVGASVNLGASWAGSGASIRGALWLHTLGPETRRRAPLSDAVAWIRS